MTSCWNADFIQATIGPPGTIQQPFKACAEKILTGRKYLLWVHPGGGSRDGYFDGHSRGWNNTEMATTTNRNNTNVYISVETTDNKQGKTISISQNYSGDADKFTLKVWEKQEDNNNPWAFMGYLIYIDQDEGGPDPPKYYSISESTDTDPTIYTARPDVGATQPQITLVDPTLGILAAGLFFNLYYDDGSVITQQTFQGNGKAYTLPASFALINPIIAGATAGDTGFAFFSQNNTIACSSSEEQHTITDIEGNKI